MAFRIFRWPLVLVVMLAPCFAQLPPRTPLSLPDIIGRLAAGSTPSYIAHLIKTRGLSFVPGAHELSLIRLAGGQGILLERVSAAFPKVLSGSSTPIERYTHLANCAEFLQLGAIDEAKQECQHASVENPASPWPLIAITRCVMTPGDRRPDAVSLLRRAVDLTPNLPEPHLALSQAIGGPEGRQELVEAERLDPDNLDVIRRKISRSPNVESELDPTLKRLSEIEPDYAPIHAAAADYYVSRQKQADALEAMRVAVRLEPDNAAMHAEFAQIYERIGDEKDRFLELAEAVRASPRSLYRREELASALWLNGKRDEAVVACRELLNLFPRYGPASGRLVNLLMEQKRRDEAIAELRRYIEATAAVPESAFQGYSRLFAQKQLGDLLFDTGDLESAAATYKSVLTQEASALTMNALGRVRFFQGRLEDAASEFRKAIQTDPELADPHYNLALCFSRQNNLDGALIELRRALEIDAQHVDARLELSRVLLRKSDADSAIVELNRILEADPDNAVATNDLAWLYATSREKRDPTAALRLANRAIELLERTSGTSPAQRAAFLDTLAEAFLMNDKANEALRTEESAMELDPNNATLAARLQRFRDAVHNQRPSSAP